MRREELALVILGELDESFIDEAMPKKAPASAGDDTVGGQRPKEFGEIAEVSKRDVRIYWITHALGMAAVVALIVGAVVLLVQNWDKIAVSGNDRPGEITDISEPVVTDSNKEPMIEEYRTGSIESSTVYGQSELFESVFYGSWEPVDVNNDADPLFLTYREDMFTFENFVYPYGITETDEIYVLPFVSDGAKECYLIKKSEPGYLYKGVWEPEGEYMSENLFTIDTVTGKYRRTEAYSDVREIRPGDEISVCGLHKILGNEKYRGNGISGRFYEEAFYTLPGGFYGGGFRVPGGFSGKGSFTDEYGTEWVIGNSRKLPASKMYYIGGDGEKTLTLALRYYKKTEYDAFTGGAGQGDIPIPQEQYFAITLQVDENGICRVNYKKAYEILLSTGNYTVSSDLSSDPFEQITDTSMPEPGINSMYGTYHDFSSPWKIKIRHILLPLYNEQKERGYEWRSEKEKIPTPYNLYNSMSLVSFCHDLNIPWENIEDNVRAWDGSVSYPPGTPPEEYEDIERFTEDELSAMRNGDTEEIAKQFASEYSVIIGENVFSPHWLYYHTIEDYSAVGITPAMINAKLEKYRALGLTDEAWKAFREKLALYCDKDVVDGSAIEVTKPEKKINLSVNTLLDLGAVTADYTYKLIEDYESDENWQYVKEWVEKTHVGENAAELLELYRSTDYFGYPDYDVQYAGNDICDYVIRKMFGFTSFVQYNSWEMFIFVKDGKAVGATDIMKRSGLGWIVDGNDLYEVATTENILHIDLLTLEYDWIPIKEGYATIADINDDWLICGNGPLHAYNRHTGEIITPDIGEWNGLYSSLMRLNGDSIEYTKEPGNGYWYDLRTGESGEDPDIYNTPILMVFESDKYRIHSYYNTVAEACPEEFDFSRISVTRKSDGLTKVFSFEELLGDRSGETDGTMLNHLICEDWFITRINQYGRIAVNFETGESADVSDISKYYNIWRHTVCGNKNFVEFTDETKTAHLFGEIVFEVTDK